MKSVLSQWNAEDAVVETVSSGLINQTFLIRQEGAVRILQSLNTQIFDPVLHLDIEAVTAHIEARGLATPKLVRTREGSLYAEVEGGCWRMLTVVGNRTIEKVQSLDDARSAGSLVARFHAATADLEHTFVNPRSQGGFHDTAAKIAGLRDALATHSGDAFYEDVVRLAERIERLWGGLSGGDSLPKRVVHGDLKISNLRFEDGAAIALIDLDTLGRGALDAELGDALRSWCNPAGEDAGPRFSLAVLGAAMEGYASSAVGITDAEWDQVVAGTIRIATELAARFAADALQRSYFGFDPALGSGKHNLLRAEGQLALAEQIQAVRSEAEAVVRGARPRP